eukprot:TRINITY_DN7693_c0_g1_i20.p1 TRINITY_DN7693_c0_g1~~TRINITY_DN7693_c0_g1_i20.p1  ORF type:complete len:187 (-),score=65.09 TRINITY_DN7693_c0_g1_i20:247-807(-)
MKKKIFKVMILGDSGVGKTSILEQYVNQVFTGKYKVTIGSDFLTRDLTINEEKIKLQIWDTAGQEKYRSLSLAYYRGADACVFVYDITDKSSFANVDTWMETFFAQVPDSQTGSFPVVVVGNKVDKEGRAVTSDAAKRWTRSHSDVALFEVSAKTGEGVETAFMEIGRLLVNRSNEGKKYCLALKW